MDSPKGASGVPDESTRLRLDPDYPASTAIKTEGWTLTTPSLSASEVGHLLAISLGAAADDLTEALDGFLPSMANELERRGLDPLQDDVPSCSRFRFLQELRQSMAAEFSHQ